MIKKGKSKGNKNLSENEYGRAKLYFSLVLSRDNYGEIVLTPAFCRVSPLSVCFD